MTKKYSAPEVIAKQPRNSSSDVFSLGCVFLDMVYALLWNTSIDADTFNDWLVDKRTYLEQLIAAESSDELVKTRDHAALWVRSALGMTQDLASSRSSIRVVATALCRHQNSCCNTCFNLHQSSE